ncbi:hypothetical protein IM774_02235 [Erysipelotrichaceae bacterium RD49]|nr:hypothetical protein [Erysipelotrichaceae bacterium RD49]
MSRKPDPNLGYRMRIQTVNGYRYVASTILSFTNRSTKPYYKPVYWGTIDEDLKFHPNTRFFMLEPEERTKFIFPEDWDLSLLKQQAQPH